MDTKLIEFNEAEAAAGQSVAGAWEETFQQTDAQAVVDRAEQVAESARIAEQQHQHEDELMALDNVVGVATSLKMTGGKPTGTWCLAVLVEQKLPLRRVRKTSQIPGQVGGVPTDVVEVGVVQPLVFNAKVRPALPGFSIGHFNITAGTLGCLVRDVRRCCDRDPCREREDDYLILSNNHVLADVNRGKPGDLILQPGPFDGGLYPSDGIATLERFEPIVFGMSGYNVVDAAVARPTYSRNVTPSIIGIAMPRAIDQALVGDGVLKVGRTTQVTNGRVLATNATIAVNYGALFGVATYRHQILTTAMSAGGDSGSLLMKRDLSAVGLLFAGSAKITIHNHIADVEVALGVRPVTAVR
jgi:hypothetical protein